MPRKHHYQDHPAKKTGPPFKLTPSLAAKIFILARRGCTTKEIAEVVDCSERSIYSWQKQPDFFAFLKSAKQESDALVVRSLFERALGYEFTTEEMTETGPMTVTKKLPPDVTACIFWLKNRQPAEWRDHHEFAGTVTVNLLDAMRQAVARKAAVPVVTGNGNGHGYRDA